MMQLPIIDSRKNIRSQMPVLNWKTDPQTAGVARERPDIYSLSQLIRQLPGEPKRTAVLGQTMDGLPLLFNLADARPGSVLVVGDRFSRKTTLLMGLALSLAQLNRPEDVRFAVITTRPEEWQELETRYPGHFMKITADDETGAEELIYHLCDLVEARQNGMHVGTAYVLLVDGMDSLAHMDVDLKNNFEWLIRCGARQLIWTVAALDSREYLAQYRFTELFKTRIIGRVEDHQTAARLMPPRFHKTDGEDDRHPFTVRIHQHWMQFSLPESLA